jgi:hypothetical protein
MLGLVGPLNRRLPLAAGALVAALVYGCGGNVVVDPGAGTAGTGASGTGSNSTGTGGASGAACTSFCSNAACTGMSSIPLSECLPECQQSISMFGAACATVASLLFECIASSATCDQSSCSQQAEVVATCCSENSGSCQQTTTGSFGSGTTTGTGFGG